MSFFAGTTQITSAGTRKQVDVNGNRFFYVVFKARADNAGAVYVGADDVSATNGMQLQPGEFVSIPRASESSLDSFYVDADNNNDELDWMGF